MKTTIELPDSLIEQARRVAQLEGVTLRALVEEGLQRSLEVRRQAAARRQLDFPSYGGKGLTEEFQGAPWSRIRDEIYREQGA
ncbi:MAG: type II toxin-antitoxin system VapB family antitoxin [Chromatiaceae bacterium]|nr:type II toxin-antitoxin system VapB family antitoxin [Chromatiaceae bacterium]